ncbi:phage tail protein [Sediminibacterium goheungense]|jgi:phage tail-like protein|uniref:Phage tail-like protein n=1 Tax=Sediminibacterium goheungense TaxID=1086393 RepID=A0A4R6IT39_9BACT|nr:phage tail protein [Sediminibacterium goheungense]TDO25672.1 phage tail-like protein [Sediminibacterium goheungense]HCL05951.1 phage tail protein [Chitinophagaceae bacterium]
MADNGAAQSAATWPLVKFQFSVKIGSDELFFQEVTGLSSETQVIEYRAGNSQAYSTVKMPGIKKFGNITLKKGIFKDDKKMWTMYNAIKMNTIERVTVVISLLDEANAVAMSWNLTNAFPCKMTVTDMKSDANEAAVETMELAHEGLTIVA